MILGLFLVAGLLSYLTLTSLQKWYQHLRRGDQFAPQYRITPFSFLPLAIVYTIVLYRLIGGYLTAWLGETF